MKFSRKQIFFFLLPLLILACKGEPEKKTITKSLQVTVSAYNNVSWQTTANNPSIAAWGDTLRPGMKAIAVSRDLPGLGLDYGKEIKIAGLPGTFKVLDKMHGRYRKHIDIYMGKDVKAAREWGRKKRIINWEMPLDSIIGEK